jgi:FAD/FMN-containing dehydrogenase
MEFHKKLSETAFEVGGRRVGLGLYFSSDLHRIHDSGSVAIMQGIKRAIDPDNIMNPGKTIGAGENRLGASESRM